LSNRSSSVFAIGAGTLADIYDPAVRGSKFGVYYASPLLGPSLGPLIGGALTQAFGWRAVFWFLVIFAAVNFFSFLLFLKDTFRRQRSLAYQAALKRRTQKREITVAEGKSSADIHTNSYTSPTNTPDAPHFDEITLSLIDVNPFPPLFRVLQRWNNIAILFPSGMNPLVHAKLQH
jgi:MFS family permease